MCPPRIAQFASLVSGQDRFPHEIEQQGVKSLKAVLVAQVISQQDVLLEEEDVVLAALNEGKPVGQNFIGCGHFFAEQSFPRSRQAVFFNLNYYLKYVLTCLAENLPPVRLEFSQSRLHHVRL